MLFFLVGPFVFFSNMRFIAAYNPINDLQLDFALQISDTSSNETFQSTYEFQLYKSQTALQVYQLTDDQFNNVYNFSTYPETKFFDPQQVQMVKMKDSSDTQWDASQESKNLLKDFMAIAANPNTSSRLNITAVLNYKFQRGAPATAMTVTGQRTKQINDTSAFSEMGKFTNCSDPTALYTLPISYFIPKRLRLGQSTDVSAIKIQKTE